MDSYGTHIPLLAWAVLQEWGPILELGAGDNSTPMLHLLAGEERLVTADYNKEWLDKFIDLKSDTHEFHHVTDWNAWPVLDEKYWGVAFVDHSPGERRAFDIARLRESAMLVVVHDTQQPTAADYKYEPVFDTFKYRFDYKRWPTWTTILSMTNDLSALKSLCTE